MKFQVECKSVRHTVCKQFAIDQNSIIQTPTGLLHCSFEMYYESQDEKRASVLLSSLFQETRLKSTKPISVQST